MIDALDAAFGAWITYRGGDNVGLAAALVSAEVGKGHVCLNLKSAVNLLQTHGLVAPRDWAEELSASETVATPGKSAPLVFDGDRLYLHRYWCYETRVAKALRNLATPVAGTDPVTLAAYVRELFPSDGSALDRQALAAVLGATRRLAIISGGPGTGKTTTVLRLIALARMLDPELSVALAAPTGKAAGRLAEVMAVGNVPKYVRESLPHEARTLHRLLGYNPARQTIRHDASTPLPYGLVVVDEASMVDLGMMARLLTALGPNARLVLVGDRDQLASVEAGAVLGDICLAASGFPGPEAARLEYVLGAPVPRATHNKLSPISSSIALLKRNYRFGEHGIGRLAQAVVDCDSETALNLLRGGDGQLSWEPVGDERQLASALVRAAEICFKPALRAAAPAEALAHFHRFRLLCAERHGAFGVEGLNARVETLLGVPMAGTWYPGRPILITENDYELGLFNGEFGVAWHADDGRLMVWIAGSDGRLRAVSPARLPDHETCYAMTVHKAQGSEFNRVTFVLPPRESAVATRELIYTAVTRAREAVAVWATEEVLRAAIQRGIRRSSGLSARLADG